MGPGLVALATILAIGWVLVARANELFFISIRGGRLLLVRGRVPAQLYEELTDVIARARIEHGELRATFESKRARLTTRSIDERTAQQLRNVLGLHTLQRLRTAPAPTTRNLGQVLGIAWLAWQLEHR